MCVFHHYCVALIFLFVRIRVVCCPNDCQIKKLHGRVHLVGRCSVGYLGICDRVIWKAGGLRVVAEVVV